MNKENLTNGFMNKNKQNQRKISIHGDIHKTETITHKILLIDTTFNEISLSII